MDFSDEYKNAGCFYLSASPTPIQFQLKLKSSFASVHNQEKPNYNLPATKKHVPVYLFVISNVKEEIISKRL